MNMNVVDWDRASIDEESDGALLRSKPAALESHFTVRQL